MFVIVFLLFSIFLVFYVILKRLDDFTKNTEKKSNSQKILQDQVCTSNIPLDSNSDIDLIKEFDTFYLLYNKIPDDIQKLLFLNTEEPQDTFRGITIRISNDDKTGRIRAEEVPKPEPSTIFTKLPVAEPNNNQYIEEPGYWPTYYGLNSYQKYIYLDWLKNIDDSIGTSYLFLFFYGLERQLIEGYFDEAFNMIIRLRGNHKIPSFLKYSKKSLVYGSIIKENHDAFSHLTFLFEEEKWSEEQLLLKYYYKQSLNASDIIKIIKGITKLNKRYVERTSFVKYINDYLFKYFKTKYVYIDNIVKQNTIILTSCLFQNTSFPNKLHNVKMFSIIHSEDFQSFINNLHLFCHDSVKKELVLERKLKNRLTKAST